MKQIRKYSSKTNNDYCKGTNNRYTNYCKEDFMFYLYNHLGDRNVAFCYNYYIAGEKYYSKWVTYEVLMHLHHDELVPGTFDTKKQFIKKVTHRSILDIELMYDMDDKFLWCRDFKYEFDTILEKSKWCYMKLYKEYGVRPVVHYTGSKGYHMSILLPKLRDYVPVQRCAVKQKLLAKYGGDTHTAANRHMIAMEGELHHKSKIKKDECMFTIYKNSKYGYC